MCEPALNSGKSKFRPDGRRSMAKKGAKAGKKGKDQNEDESESAEEAFDTTQLIADMTEVSI